MKTTKPRMAKLPPGAVTVTHLRRRNRGAVLRAVAQHGPLSRTALARLTQLSQASISRLVEELVALRLVREQAGGAAPMLGVGLGSVGLVHPEQGVVLDLPRLGWARVPLREMAEQLFGLPADLDSGVRNTALAEAWFGAGQTASSVLLLLAG